MKIYAFTDLHGNTRAFAKVKTAVKEQQPDLVICCGDLTIFEQELKALLSRINLLKVPVLMLHGNHEGEERMRRLCKEFSRITFLHKEFVEIGGYIFVAFGGGGFSDEYPELEKLAKQKEWRALDWERVVFLSHAPPFDTALDDVGEEGEPWHVGSHTLRDVAKEKQPLLILAGHIHEGFGKESHIKRTLCLNPGPSGELIDLEKLSQKRRKS